MAGGEGNGNPLQYSYLENDGGNENAPAMDGGARQAAVHGVAKSQTRLSDFTFIFTFTYWRGKWQPTPVFLPGESQGWRGLVGCRLWGHTELDTTEATQHMAAQDGSTNSILVVRTRYLDDSIHTELQDITQIKEEEKMRCRRIKECHSFNIQQQVSYEAKI